MPVVGDRVSWRYGSGRGRGKVEAIHPKRFVGRVGGAIVIRNGTKANPVLVINSNGRKVVQMASKVRSLPRL